MVTAGLVYINIAFFPAPLKNGTNFPKQLLKLPTQRPSHLPWGPRPGPIEHFYIFFNWLLFLYHQHKFTTLFFSAHSTSKAHICWRWAALPFADQTFWFRFRFAVVAERDLLCRRIHFVLTYVITQAPQNARVIVWAFLSFSHKSPSGVYSACSG